LFRTGRIQFHENGVTVGKRLGTFTGTFAANVTELLRQAERYSKLSEEGKTIWSKDKSGFTGKINGMQDDLIMVLMMLAYFPGEFLIRPMYANHR